MRIRLVIGVLVMPPMYADPAGWGVLDTAQTKNGKGMLEPFRTDEAPVGQHTMKA